MDGYIVLYRIVCEIDEKRSKPDLYTIGKMHVLPYYICICRPHHHMHLSLALSGCSRALYSPPVADARPPFKAASVLAS